MKSPSFEGIEGWGGLDPAALRIFDLWKAAIRYGRWGFFLTGGLFPVPLGLIRAKKSLALKG
jgi:hypothetical protein